MAATKKTTATTTTKKVAKTTKPAAPAKKGAAKKATPAKASKPKKEEKPKKKGIIATVKEVVKDASEKHPVATGIAKVVLGAATLAGVYKAGQKNGFFAGLGTKEEETVVEEETKNEEIVEESDQQ